MKKPFALVTTSLMLVITALASPIGKEMGEQLDVQITPREEQLGRPRTTPIFTAYLDTDLDILSISALYNVGDVSAVIENLTTRESSEYVFASSSTALLPISGDSGYWRITLSLESGEDYYGVFFL